MLTPEQANVLHAVLDRIIPPDDFPGACEAGVVNYIERQFERDFRDLKDYYANGLDALDAEARARSGECFAAMAEDGQDALLARIEQGDVAGDWRVDPAQFFQMLVDHAMEGYYADPDNGGNRDGASWRMIGFTVSD